MESDDTGSENNDTGWVVYMLTNQVNGKRYIGQTMNLRKRIAQHRLHCQCPLLAKAIAKHGWVNFSVCVLNGCSCQTRADELERHYIEEKQSHVSVGGYNLDWGGRGGGAKSDDTKKKISAAARGRTHTEETKEKLRTRIVSDETRKLISEARKGVKVVRSPTTCKRLSEALKGKVRSTDHCLKLSEAKRGKPLSAEHRQKLSAASKGKKRGPYRKGTGDKISAALKGKKQSKPRSEEHCRKLSEALKGKTKSAIHVQNNVASHKRKRLQAYTAL
jgi:group I intron endonuclease